MILDDENILVNNTIKDVGETIYCERLGKIYMTKQGSMGYVWNLDKNGLPKTLVYSNNNEVRLDQLYDLEKSFERVEKEEGLYIPTFEQFRSSMSSWNDLKYDILKIMEHLIQNAYSDLKVIKYKYLKTKNICPLDMLGGNYWLKYGPRTFRVDMEIQISEYTGFISTHPISTTWEDLPSKRLLLMKDLKEHEVQTWEESSKMIQETLDGLVPQYAF